MAGPPAAFMSYARFNDQHHDGQLTAFRERLSAEIQVQTGEEFLIFQDHTSIAWGQNWQQRIGQALEAVTLLLVIITPGFCAATPSTTARQAASTSMTRDWGPSKTTTSPPTPTPAWRSAPAATPRCAATGSTAMHMRR